MSAVASAWTAFGGYLIVPVKASASISISCFPSLLDRLVSDYAGFRRFVPCCSLSLPGAEYPCRKGGRRSTRISDTRECSGLRCDHYPPSAVCPSESLPAVYEGATRT